MLTLSKPAGFALAQAIDAAATHGVTNQDIDLSQLAENLFTVLWGEGSIKLDLLQPPIVPAAICCLDWVEAHLAELSSRDQAGLSFAKIADIRKVLIEVGSQEVAEAIFNGLREANIWCDWHDGLREQGLSIIFLRGGLPPSRSAARRQRLLVPD